MNIEEGGKCLECDGIYYLPKVEGCYCHIDPPCSSCVNNKLVCNKCGWSEDNLEIANEDVEHANKLYLHKYQPFEGYEYIIDENKRLYNVFYNGNSGSTMEFKGNIEGHVTEEDIFKCLGDGTFGHRGPFIYGNTFLYTKITD